MEVIKIITKVKRGYAFLLNKNKLWIILILLSNLILSPFIYIIYKFCGDVKYWQDLLLGVILFVFTFLLWNLMIAYLIEIFEPKQKNITTKLTAHKEIGLFWTIFISLSFLTLVILYLFYPQFLPSWFVKFLRGLGGYNRYYN